MPLPRMLAPLALLGLAIPGLSLAATSLNSLGFEPPAFAPGNIVTQQGWNATPGSLSTATVQTTVVQSGQQAVRLDRLGGEDRYWAVQPLGAPSGRFVTIDWDMRVQATGATNAFGPFFGVAAFDQQATQIAAVASLGVDATTGDILYQEGGTGFLVETPLDATPGTWLHYRIDLDFGTDTYRAFVNGQLVATTGFIDAALGINRITDADLAAFDAAGDPASSALNGTAYFDNFVIRDGVRGDFNADGLVNAADYTVYRDQLGQTGWGLAADADSNGAVTTADYAIWSQLYGQTNSLGGPAVSVPEPAALALVAMILATKGLGRAVTLAGR